MSSVAICQCVAITQVLESFLEHDLQCSLKAVQACGLAPVLLWLQAMFA